MGDVMADDVASALTALGLDVRAKDICEHGLAHNKDETPMTKRDILGAIAWVVAMNIGADDD